MNFVAKIMKKSQKVLTGGVENLLLLSLYANFPL